MLAQMLWGMAGALIAAALLAMAVLVIGRLRRARRDVRREAAAARLKTFLMQAMAGAPVDGVGGLTVSPRLLAETLLQISGLVSGAPRRLMADTVAARGGVRLLAQGSASRHRQTRLASIEALGLFRPSEAAIPLRMELHDPDPLVRIASVIALAGLEAPISAGRLLDIVLGCGRAASARVGDALTRLAQRDPGVFTAALERADVDDAMRAAMLTALGQAGQIAAAPVLFRHAVSTSAAVRAAALDSLGVLKHPDAEGFIARGLGDADWQVRAASIRAARSAPFRALAPAVQALRNDPFWLVRFEARGRAAT